MRIARKNNSKSTGKWIWANLSMRLTAVQTQKMYQIETLCGISFCGFAPHLVTRVLFAFATHIAFTRQSVNKLEVHSFESITYKLDCKMNENSGTPGLRFSW